ncbi:uncharacterized protein VICG_00402 [Vittaforma corneae ATCC 50505]|uniref:60S acidic ribosomal protein P2 n=1 Tax=Vittaforma corneae (strain ATCC 50505) TaxID=993615 RepID=L2GQ90_VITCO|nr:uncharacterized protein VICG_00402 [Vittaforma corneae ATCC 50505]ELA42650.1 hypothetical protein VICG_00402 [Vittaforma corneae ATCC 50505]
MEYITAFSLIAQNSTEMLSKDAMKSKIVSLLNSIQAPVCEESLDLFLSKVDGKSFSELIAAGGELMKSQISAGPSTAAKTTTAAPAKVEKVEEEESESDANLDFF